MDRKKVFGIALFGGAVAGALGSDLVIAKAAAACDCLELTAVKTTILTNLKRNFRPGISTPEGYALIPVADDLIYSGVRTDTKPTFYLDFEIRSGQTGTFFNQVCRSPFSGVTANSDGGGTWACGPTNSLSVTNGSSTVINDFYVDAGAPGGAYSSLASVYDYGFIELWPHSKLNNSGGYTPASIQVAKDEADLVAIFSQVSKIAGPRLFNVVPDDILDLLDSEEENEQV